MDSGGIIAVQSLAVQNNPIDTLKAFIDEAEVLGAKAVANFVVREPVSIKPAQSIAGAEPDKAMGITHYMIDKPARQSICAGINPH